MFLTNNQSINHYSIYSQLRYNSSNDRDRVKNMSVLQRTIRITLSALLANFVAMLIGLENPYAAGIIAILAVLNTRKETMERAKEYVISTILAFTIATVVFFIFGFSIYSFAVYLAIYVPMAYNLKVDAGIAPCSVLVTHFLISGSVSMAWQINGFSIMVIGLFFALLANFWIPSHDEKLGTYVVEIEKQMTLVLFLLEKRLLEETRNNTRIKQELKDLFALTNQLEDLAFIEYSNRRFLIDSDNYYIKYAQMRKRQYEILKGITDSLVNVIPNTNENKILASIFGETAEQLDEKNTGIELLSYIGNLYRVFRDSSLPKTRKEFESRAILYNILIEFEVFLELKRDFYQEFGEMKSA